MRARAHYLGIVYAPDQQVAEVAAVAEYKIGEEQRRRLIVREPRGRDGGVCAEVGLMSWLRTC
jgi:hypothetical protein